MLSLLTKKPCAPKLLDGLNLNEIFTELKAIYDVENVSEERRQYLAQTIQKYGYLPYPHYKTLEELSAGEVIFALEQKLLNEGTYNGIAFASSALKNPSVLARKGVKDSNWFKKEGHNVKLISLSALADGEKTKDTGKFINWCAQLITLPMGNRAKGVYPTTIYLIPFHPREFECAYLPTSSDISPKLEDKELKERLNLDAKAQVKLFIALAQLSAHPVIYDILPQTSRYSKIVLANPWVARWFDIDALTSQIEGFLEAVVRNMNEKKGKKPFAKADVDAAKKVYTDILKGSKKKYTKLQAQIVEKFEEDLKEYKILASYKMSFKEKQEEILKKVNAVITAVNGSKPKCEEDVTKQGEIIKALIKEGLWPAPGGAWCSAGVPIFEKMNPTREYPLFKHYDCKTQDVTHFANLDCQTPYYFNYLESKKYNYDVIDFYLDYTKKLQNEYNFDGFRVDHIDHIVDQISQDSQGNPISYRTPQRVLGKANSKIKSNVPYFATLAEYMLWDNFYREYHKDMHFDSLWGNDIICQSAKTPEQIIEDNKYLAAYNAKSGGKNPLSILKTYNNQDGEFEAINQYPGQLGEAGALFKWFKYKFIPGGKGASRPTMFVDGDESLTKTGIERIIGKETSMIRAKNWHFFERFDALNRFVEQNDLILNGRAELIYQDEDGFAAWKIVAAKSSEAILVAANYLAPTEVKDVQEGEKTVKKQVKGHTVRNKTVKFEGQKLTGQYDFRLDEDHKCEFAHIPFEHAIENEITFHELKPSEFKVYKLGA